MSERSGTEKKNIRAEIKTFIARKLNFFREIATSEKGSESAILAKLRLGVGREPGELPQLFGIILSGMPEGFLGDDGKATKEEWVCYTTLTLYALHQQGYDIRKQPMHTGENISIGAAMSKLAAMDEDSNTDARLLHRLQTIATSLDKKELSYHLRALVKMFRSKEIALNYVLLAENLYDFQYPDRKTKVCLKWGQDFYREKGKKEQDSAERKIGGKEE